MKRGSNDFGPLVVFNLVEHLGAEVGQGRPGDQDGTDNVGCALHDISPMGVFRLSCEAVS